MAHIQDRGREYARRWQARYRDDAGKEKSQTFERKLDAQRWLDQKTAALVRGDYIDPRAGAVTFETFARQWLTVQTFNPSTHEAVSQRLRTHVLPQLGELELRRIRPSTIQAWLRDRQEILAPTTVRVILANLSSILGAAVDDELIRKNPCSASSVRAPSLPNSQVVPWTDGQVAAVLDELPARWRGIGALAAGCGLRQGEAFGVHLDDLDFLGRRVLVRHQVKRMGGTAVIAPPKRNKTREVPLPERVAFVLAETLRAWPAREDGLVFVSRQGNPVDRNHFNRSVWRPAIVRAGLEPVRGNGTHALRHYFASTLMASGVNPRAVADYLGHEDPGFTLRVYGHLLPDDEDRVRRTMDAALAPASRGMAAES